MRQFIIEALGEFIMAIEFNDILLIMPDNLLNIVNKLNNEKFTVAELDNIRKFGTASRYYEKLYKEPILFITYIKEEINVKQREVELIAKYLDGMLYSCKNVELKTEWANLDNDLKECDEQYETLDNRITSLKRKDLQIVVNEVLAVYEEICELLLAAKKLEGYIKSEVLL